jgi:3-oxoacyl-[acyl-carrier-protein] synthase II
MMAPVGELVVTGVGLVSPAGAGVDVLAASLEAGATHLAVSPGAPWPAASVDDRWMSWPTEPPWRDLAKYAGRAARLAVAAARQALERADGRASSPAQAERSATVVAVEPDGSEWASLAAVLAAEDDRPPARRLFDDLDDFHIIRTMPTMAAQMVALAAGYLGSSTTVSRPAVGGLAGLSLAMRLLEDDEVDRVLVVGSDPVLPPHALCAVDASEPLATAATRGCGPFDRGRRGTWFGEGAAALLLERDVTAAARGAETLGRVIACETRCGTSPGAAARTAIDQVLAIARRTPDIVFAHGGGSSSGDRIEAEILAGRVRAPITATKGCIGNLLATSGLVDLSLALTFLRAGRVPPVCLLQEPDPDLPRLDLVLGSSRPVDGARSALLCASDATGVAGAALIEVG